MTDLFKNAADFNQNIASWNIIDVSNATDMFEGSGQNVANATATSDGWQAQVVQEQQIQEQVLAMLVYKQMEIYLLDLLEGIIKLELL